ncbi:hypothetical protein DFH11DRAFT_1725807 [Phellopilus nigrolimitatus]|nr:hypothetical protein DFH11DRAFT_1725807 [Phellopilus nigrolimitatus]
MEAASTLPGLKDLFPEHFFQQASQSGSPSQPGSILPQSPALSQATSSSRQHEIQHFNQQQQQQQPHPDQIIFPHTFQHPHAHHTAHSGGHAVKHPYDAAHAHAGGRQDHYMFGPDMGMGPGPGLGSAMGMGMDPGGLGAGGLVMGGIGGGGNGGGMGPGGFGGGSGMDGSDDGMDDGDDGDDGEDDNGREKRRHPCPQCGKRFNRPSSLKIHLNTHTGAKREQREPVVVFEQGRHPKARALPALLEDVYMNPAPTVFELDMRARRWPAAPFACPYPGCGRSFNVSSNMRRHYRNHARRPSGALMPSTSYPIPYTKSNPNPHNGQRVLLDQQQHPGGAQQYAGQRGYAVAQPQADMFRGSGRPVTHAQLYPRKSNMRTGARQQQAAGVGEQPPTPPYTEESEFGGAEYERDDEGEYAYGAVGGPGAALGGPYGGAGPSGPMYPAPSHSHAQQDAHAGMSGQMAMTVPVEMAFPVDPALEQGGGGGDQDADAEGEVDPDAEGEEVDEEGDGDAEGEGEDEDEYEYEDAPTGDAGGNGPKGTRGRKPTSTSASPNALKGRGSGAPHPPPGLQFHQVLVPVGDPAFMQQTYAQYQAHYAQYGYPYPFPMPVPAAANAHAGGTGSEGGAAGDGSGAPYPPQGYVAYPAVYAYAAPQHAHATSAMRTSGGSANGKAKAGTKSAAKPPPAKELKEPKEPEKEEKEEKETPNPRALPQSNARATRASTRQSSGDGTTPGAAPDPPYKLYTYPPPPQPEAAGAAAGAGKKGEGEKASKEAGKKEKEKEKDAKPKKGGKRGRKPTAKAATKAAESDAESEAASNASIESEEEGAREVKGKGRRGTGRQSPRKKQKGETAPAARPTAVSPMRRRTRARTRM